MAGRRSRARVSACTSRTRTETTWSTSSRAATRRMASRWAIRTGQIYSTTTISTPLRPRRRLCEGRARIGVEMVARQESDAMKLRWVSDAPPWTSRAEAIVAHELGFFREAGIDEADIRVIPGERNAVEALLAGEVDVISGMARKAMIAHAQGHPV